MQNYTIPGRISQYLSLFDKEPDDEISIADLIKRFQGHHAYDYRKDVEFVRKGKTKEERDERKKKLHAYAISGTFKAGGRRADLLSKHSGLICIDIDGKDNPDQTIDQLKETAKKTPSLILVSESATGTGIFAIHRIEIREESPLPDHLQQFKQLEQMYRSKGIIIDEACKDVTRLRFATHDQNLFITNDDPYSITPLPLLDEFWPVSSDQANRLVQPSPPTMTATTTAIKPTRTHTPPQLPRQKATLTTRPRPSVFDYQEEDIKFAIEQINAKKIDLPLEISKNHMGSRHSNWVRIGYALTNLGEGGRAYFHEISKHYSNYGTEKTDKKFDELLRGSRGSVSMGSLRYMIRKVGIQDRDPRKTHVLETAIHHRKRIGQNGGPTNPEDCKDTIKKILIKIEKLPEEYVLPYVEKVFEAPKELLGKEKDRDKENIDEIIAFVNSYPLKHNTRTAHLEIDGDEIGNKQTQTITIQAKKEFGKSTPSELIHTIMQSHYIPSYDPFKEFLQTNELHPNQRGVLDEFIESIRIANDREGDIDFARILIRKWLLGVIASMMGTHSVLCLVLCGRQNIGKTRFFRELLPDALKRYYCEDKFDPGKDSYLLMTKKLIICDDEFGGKSKKEAKLFKEILSKQAITIRKPYDRVSEDLTRLSVFCGTTNDEHILNDPTGNRRILPVQITGIHFEKMDKIDRTGLWIELYRLWKEDPNGFFLNSEEIATLNAYGRERFEETSIEKDVISHLMYLPAELESLRLESEEDLRYLLQTKRTIVSTSWIKKTGEDGNRFQLSTKKIGEQMKSLGFKQTSAPKSDPLRMIAYKQRGWIVVLR